MPIKQTFIAFLQTLIRKQRVDPRQIDYASIRSVLVIRQHDQLGDFLLSTPVFGALRHRFPGARIGALVRDYFGELILHHPDIDEVIFFEKQNQWSAKGLRELVKKIYRRWDLVVVLNTVSHSLSSDLFAQLSGARYILGPVSPSLDGKGGNCFYNVLSPLASEPRHQTEKNLDIVRTLGADADDRGEKICILDSEKEQARSELRQQGVSFALPVIGMHPGAGKIPNRWPIERFVQLAQRLHESGKGEIVLYSGPSERALMESFRAMAKFPFIEMPPLSLRGLAASLTQCSLFVCNDTGVMHVGAATDVPLVATFGPTDPVYWKPLGDRYVALRGEDGKIENVTVDSVFAAVCSRLDLIMAQEKLHAGRLSDRS